MQLLFLTCVLRFLQYQCELRQALIGLRRFDHIDRTVILHAESTRKNEVFTVHANSVDDTVIFTYVDRIDSPLIQAESSNVRLSN